MTTHGQFQLFNLEAEQAVLGALFLRKRALDDLAGKLRPDDFSSSGHSEIWRAALDLHKAGTPVDLVTLTRRLEERKSLASVGGPVYLAELANSPVSAANALHHAEIVAELAMRRDVEERCGEMLASVRDPSVTVEGLVGSSTKALASIVGRVASGEVSSAADVTDEVLHEIEARQTDPNRGRGVSTGFQNLDRIINGLNPSDLIVAAARPGVGKTALALGMALRGAQAGFPALIFSMEMSKEQLFGRLLCSLGGVNTCKLRSALPLSADEMSRLATAAKRLQNAAVFVDDSPALHLMELQAKARRFVRERGVRAIYVDYISLVRSDVHSDRSREQEVSAISAGLKALAKELSIPVVALAQLNRAVEARKSGEPMLSDLRESGAIEQDADIVMFLHNQQFASSGQHADVAPVQILVKKHRHGPCGSASLIYRAPYTSFEDQAPEAWH